MLNVTGRCGLTDCGRIGKDMPAVGSRLPKPALEYAGDACKTKDNGSGDKRTNADASAEDEDETKDLQ